MGTRYHKAARRYARALLSLTQENSIAEKAYADMQLLDRVFEENKSLKVLMKSPIIREGKKQSVVKEIFEPLLDPLTLNYLLIVIRKQRAALLPDIARAFIQVYKESEGIETVRVITAEVLNETLRDQVLKTAERTTSKKIEFQESLDPAIIGGFIIHIGEKQYDASVRSKLSTLRKRLIY